MGEFKMGPIKLNVAAFRALRTSEAAKALVMRSAEAIAAAASESGYPYNAKQSPGRNRARAVVAPSTPEAARDSAANLTLLRSLDAGRF